MRDRAHPPYWAIAGGYAGLWWQGIGALESFGLMLGAAVVGLVGGVAAYAWRRG